MDDKIKTPYSYMLDFSVGRELPRGFSVQATYVGRLAHRLLSQSDLAMPLDLVDPKTGVDYFKAIRPLSEAARNGVEPRASIPPPSPLGSHNIGRTSSNLCSREEPIASEVARRGPELLRVPLAPR